MFFPNLATRLITRAGMYNRMYFVRYRHSSQRANAVLTV